MKGFFSTRIPKADGPFSWQPMQTEGRSTHARRGKRIPAWALDPDRIKEILLAAFPGMETDQVQRKKAARWNHLIYLYYAAFLTRLKCAGELGVSLSAIDSLLIRINRVARGLSANGRQRRKIGRPPKTDSLKTKGLKSCARYKTIRCQV
jgi:hypothetical protein